MSRLVSAVESRRRVLVALSIGLLLLQVGAALAQNLGGSPQFNSAVQGQTGAQPEGAFLNFINWIGNVICPVGAGGVIAAGFVSYMAGRGFLRYLFVALGLLAVSGLTRLLEFWITQGGGGVS